MIRRGGTITNNVTPSQELVYEDAFAVPNWFYQQKSWVADPRNSSNAVYNYPLAFRIQGLLDYQALKKSLEEIVRRHNVLRSLFCLENGSVVQKVRPAQLLSVPVKDLSGVDDCLREEQALQEAQRESRKSFDLTRDPPVRPLLLRLGPEDHVLVLATHHLVYDDWSNGILFRELAALYPSYSEGKPSPLPEMTYRYGDFARWQAKRLQGDELKSRLSFWGKTLSGGSDFHHLATDHPRPAERTYRGSLEKVVLPPALTTGLQILSQRERISLFMVLLAGFQSLLHRYSGDEDIVVGSCSANRPLVEVEGLIGRFGNDLVIRTNFSHNPTFRELLGRVRESSLNAYSYQDLPFGEVIEHLSPNHRSSRNPLFQIMFIFQNAPKENTPIPGLSLSAFPLEAKTAKYDLNVWLRSQNGLEVALEYNVDLFESPTIRKILTDYQTVLESMVQNPDASVSNTPIDNRQPIVSDTPRKMQYGACSATEDAIERQLISIWEDVLKVHPIGINQNYFELGGDSLMAAGLFAQLESVFQVKLPIASLLHAPTIEQQAALIRQKGPSSSWSPLVPIQMGGSRPPLYLVHGAGGNVLIYRSLALHLGPNQTVYGLQSQGLDGKQPLLTRIQDMAALYVQEIKKVQPRGPYLLGGYCMGGTLALEMAQNLRAQGEEVPLLALIDTSNWANVSAGSFPDDVWFHWQKIKFHLQNFLLLDSRDKLSFLSDKIKVLRSRTSVWLGMVQSRIRKKNQAVRNNSLVVLAQLWELNEQAAFDYVPIVYPGRITQFRPVSQYSRYDGPEKGWRNLASEGVEVIDLQVYPGGMLVEPFVADLAARLSSCIERLISRRFANADSSLPRPAGREI